MSDRRRIAVIGAGAWGTALANVAAGSGHDVALWTRSPTQAAALTACRENPRLPGTRIADRISVTAKLDVAIADADAVLLAVPTQAVREVVSPLKSLLPDGTPTVACAKGIERGTKRFLSEILDQCLPGAVPAVLSGPSFAQDVVRGLPTAVTIAARDDAMSRELAHMLGTSTFRLYHSTDMRGVEIGGAAKNVLAIAAGIVRGRQLGDSAAAALTTRGFAELARFGRARGALPETLTGLAGLGDLILTCSSEQSRNFSLGIALGKGIVLEQVQADGKLAEGVFTASALVELAQESGVDMPISNAVAAVLDRRLDLDEAIESLLARPLRSEHEG